MAMMYFQHAGYATEANARKKLERVNEVKLALPRGEFEGVTRSYKLVAVQDGRYYPVVVLRPEEMWAALALARLGIMVVN